MSAQPAPRWSVLLALFVLIGAAVWIRLDVGRLPSEFLEEIHSTEDGSRLLYAKDPYYFLRLSQQQLETGAAGTEVRDGAAWDTGSFAPQGRRVAGGLLVTLQAWAYRLTGGSLPLMRVAALLPVFLATLALLPVFALGRRIGGLGGGLAAGALYTLHPELVGQSFDGLADTNALAILLFSVAAWTFLRFLDAFEDDDRKGAAIYAGATALALLLLRMSWAGWWAAGALILVFLAGVLSLEAWRRRDSPKGRTSILALVGVTAVLALLLVASWDEVRKLALYASGGAETFFPSGLAEVTELQGLSAGRLIELAGGPVLALVALLTLPFALFAKPRRAALYCLLWLLPLLVAGLGSRRFLGLAIVPLVILVGGGAARLATWASRPGAGRELQRPGLARVSTSAFLVVLVGVCLANAWPRLGDLRELRPRVDKAFYALSEEIRQRAPKDAILHTWWDNGYPLAALAQRPVSLDGGTFRTPRLYWLSKALTTEDEQQAVGILRLVTCGNEQQLFRLLRDATDSNRLRSVEAMHEILALPDGAQAAQRLADLGFPRNVQQQAAELAFCQPRPALLVLTEDLLDKSATWGHYGQWTFGEPPGPPRALIGATNRCQAGGGGLVCSGGAVVPFANPRLEVIRENGRVAVIDRVVPGEWKRAIYQSNGLVESVGVAEEILDSVFTRLYFLRGHGMRHFRPFAEASEKPYGMHAAAFEIVWDPPPEPPVAPAPPEADPT